MSKNYCKFEKKWCNCCTNHGCTYLCGKCSPMKSANAFNTMTTCPKRNYYRTVSLKELVMSARFDDVWNSIMNWFPSEERNKEGYENAFIELKELKPKKFNNSNNWYLTVKISQSDGDRLFLNTSIYNKRTSTNTYAIDLMDWEKLLYLNIDPILYNIKRDVKVEDIIAGVLYEITFFGYSLKDRKENLKWTRNIA